MKFVVTLYNDKNSDGNIDYNDERLRNTNGYIILEDVTTTSNSHHGYTTSIVNGVATFNDVGPRLPNNVFSTIKYNVYIVDTIPSTTTADSIPSSLIGSNPSYIKFTTTTLSDLSLPSNCTKPDIYPKQISINSNSQKIEVFNYPVKYNLDLSSGCTLQARVFNDKNKDGLYNNLDTLVPNIYLTLKGPINSTTITECISRQTISTTSIANDATSTFKINNAGTYYLYETNTPLFGVISDTVFDGEFDQPISYSSPTTPRQFKISVTSNMITTNSIVLKDFGHSAYNRFPLDKNIYLSIYKNNTTPTTISSIDLVTGNKSYSTVYNDKKFDALGFNIRDGLIYACDTNQNSPTKYYRIENDTNYSAYEITFLIDKDSESKWTPDNKMISTMGCLDPLGNYYFNQMDLSAILLLNLSIPCKKINLNPSSLKFGYVYSFSLPSISLLGLNLYPFSDWVWNKVDNKLYSFNKTSNDIVSFELSSSLNVTLTTLTTDLTGILSSLALLDKKTNIICILSDPRGIIYLIDSSFNLFRCNINTSGAKSIEFISQLNGFEGSGDGTSSGEASTLIDFGNAPDDGTYFNSNNYKTSIKNSKNGPRHAISDKIFLGNIVLPESDGTNELNPIDNDSLVNTLRSLDIYAKDYTTLINVYNNTGKVANLYAWLDFNTNGIFEVNESFVTTIPSGPQRQTVSLNFTKPDTTVPTKKNTYIRIRITSDNLSLGSASSTSEDPRSLGPASDGEVEDYRLIIRNTPTINCIKSVYPTSEVVIGNTLVYTVTISNTGSVNVNNIVITDTIPNSTKWISGSYIKEGILTTISSESILSSGLTIPSLNPSENIILTYTVTVI